MKKIDRIAFDVAALRKSLIEKVPSHFSVYHVVAAFFGALFFGFTFVLKGLLLQVGLRLSVLHIAGIILVTLLILTAEIYFVGYRRVNNKKTRKFGQFLLKRLVTYYSISLIVAWLLLFLYGVLTNLVAVDVLRLVVAVSFPAAIGAAVSDLLNQY